MKIKFIIYLLVLISFTVANTSLAGESGVTPNTISLPDGPGSIEGLGEEFEPSANSGTVTYGIEIGAPGGSGGSKPSLKLVYDGGKGNSGLGFGWSLPLPRIQRQTDKGLPRYDGTDTYIYQDGSVHEELVPFSDGSFRLKNESAFIRVTNDGSSWEVKTKSGITYRLGQTLASQVKDQTGANVFAWNITQMEDTNGNLITFNWSSNGNQSYIESVQYNNYGSSVICEVLFEYESRPDALTSYRSTFPVTTSLRLSKIEVRRGGNLMRAYDLNYDFSSALSRLVNIKLIGMDGKTSMPPLVFEYTKFSPQAQTVVEMTDPPGQGLIDPNNALIDINGDALPDMVISQTGNYRYYINEDGTNWVGSYSMARSPSYELSQDGVGLSDIDGDGLSDLIVARDVSANKFYPGDGNGDWQAPVSFDLSPVGFELGDADTRFVDLNGDRLIDVLRTNLTGLSAWIHNGDGSFERLSSLPRIDSSEDVRFSDSQIHLADFNGDGLLDVARLRSGNLVYWPAVGYGLFDDPVIMTGSPSVDDETKLKITDLNSDGLADVVYLGNDYIQYWLNLGNLTLSEGSLISGTPSIDPVSTSVQFADMNGNGTTDILWVDVSGGVDGSWRYLDVVGDQFTGLITKIDNGLGKVASIKYQSSTVQMIEAASAGAPWDTTIPFPTTVISQVTVDDGLGMQTVVDYTYRNGYYDGIEREFRGFASAAKKQIGDSSMPTLITSWSFDTGGTQEALKGKPITQEFLDESGVIFERVENTWSTEVLAEGTDGRQIVLPILSTVVKSIIEGSSSPKYIRQEFRYDEYGNVTDELNHGQVASATDDGSVPMGEDEVFAHRDYATNETAWILDKLSREQVFDGQGTKLAENVNYYDGAVFTGLPIGQVERGNLVRQKKWLNTEDRYVPVARYRHDEWGNVTAILDALDGRREVFYDSESHTYPIKERIYTGSDALEFTAEYDNVFGKISKVADTNGISTSYTYDNFGRITSVVKPGDLNSLPTTIYEYNVDAPLSIITVRNREVSGSAGTLDSLSYMDGLGRARAEATEDDGGMWVVSKATLYNARGEKTFVADPFRCASIDANCPLYGASLNAKSGMILSYDAKGRVIKRQNPDGTFGLAIYLPLEEQFFDENDNDAGSPHYNTPTTKRYDGQGRLLSISFINGAEEITTQYQYDGLGNIVSIIDPAGNIRAHNYDSLGRMVSLDDPNAGHRDYIYDDNGQLIEKRKPDGYVVRVLYEATTNRILARNLVTSPDDDTWEVKYHYDSASGEWDKHGDYLKGRLVWIEDVAGKEYFGYDTRGRVTNKRRMLGANVYDLVLSYDAMDREVGINYPDGTQITKSYDDRGMLKAIGTYLVDRTYTAAGLIETEVLGDGMTRNYSYDARSRLQDLLVMDATGKTIQQFHYDFDLVGNITAIQDIRNVDDKKIQNQEFGYDNLYRLLDSKQANGDISWTYDAVGNITSRLSTINDGRLNTADINYEENGAGPYAMTTAGGKTFGYDVNGNLTQMAEMLLEFDPLDRLTKVSKQDGSVVEMVYDYDGQRKIKKVTKTDGSVEETLYVDPRYEVRGETVYKYIWADGKRLARIEE